jgi:hypothetical protein
VFRVVWFIANPILLLLGVFIPTRIYPFYKKVGQILSRFSWEIPQTSLGLLSGWFLLLSGKSDTLIFAHGTTIIKCKSRFGGFCLGCYIAGDKEITSNYNDRLFQHEYGHYLQSMSSGLIYLFKYALPSVISAWRNNYYGRIEELIAIGLKIINSFLSGITSIILCIMRLHLVP